MTEVAIVASPTRRSATKHARILAAAAAVVEEVGYLAATIEAIATRAGVGKQTIYRWWPAKPYLFVEVYRSLVPEESLRPDGGNARSDLVKLLQTLFDAYHRTPAAKILAGLVSEMYGDPNAAEAVRRELIIGRRGLIADILHRGRSRGDLPADTDVDWICDTITGHVWYRLLTAPDRLDRIFARRLADSVLQAP